MSTPLSIVENRSDCLKDWKAADEAREAVVNKGIVAFEIENVVVWKRARDVEQCPE